MEVSREKKREKRNDRPPPKDLLSPHEKTKVWGSPSRSARRRAALTAIAVAVLAPGERGRRRSRSCKVNLNLTRVCPGTLARP